MYECIQVGKNICVTSREDMKIGWKLTEPLTCVVAERINKQRKAISMSSSGNERAAYGRHASSLCLSVDGRPFLDAPEQWCLVHDDQPVGTVLQCRQSTVVVRFLLSDLLRSATQRLQHQRLVVVDAFHQMIVQLGLQPLRSITTCEQT